MVRLKKPSNTGSWSTILYFFRFWVPIIATYTEKVYTFFSRVYSKAKNIFTKIRTFERAMGNRGHISKLINHYRTLMIRLWYSEARGVKK